MFKYSIASVLVVLFLCLAILGCSVQKRAYHPVGSLIYLEINLLQKKDTMAKKNQRQYRSVLNYETGEHSLEKVNDTVSMAIPDCNYTVQELLEKFTTGIIPDTAYRNPIYDDDQESLEVSSPIMQDLTEIDEAKAYVDSVTSEIEQAKIKGDQERTKKKKSPEKEPSVNDEQNDETKGSDQGENNM